MKKFCSTGNKGGGGRGGGRGGGGRGGGRGGGDRGGGGGRDGYRDNQSRSNHHVIRGHHPNQVPDSTRKFLDKAIRSDGFEINNVGTAKRLVEALIKHDDGTQLLNDLTSSKYHGREFIQGILQQCEESSMSSCAIPLISYFMKFDKPLHRYYRDCVLRWICDTPMFLTTLQRCVGDCTRDEGSLLVKFGIRMICCSKEMINNTDLNDLSQALSENSFPECEKLRNIFGCNTLRSIELESKIDEARSQLSKLDVVVGEVDKRPPGGRHSNDFATFREISVIPTADEMLCEDPPFLPLSSGLNRFIRDDETHFLDSAFRLLRHDAVEPVREALQLCDASLSQTQSVTPHGMAGRNFRVYSGCKVLGIYLYGKGEVSMPPSVVIGFHLPAELETKTLQDITEFWRYSSKLQHSSIICLRHDGKPVVCGTVTVDKWLYEGNCRNPRIGVSFENREQMMACLEFLSFNGSRVADSILDIVALSTGFFSSVNILKQLQRMHEVPLAEYLLPRSRRPYLNTREEYLKEIPPYLHQTLYIPDTDCPLPKLADSSKEEFINGLLAKTTFDLSQAQAMHHALTNRVALIQGPPGTGNKLLS